MLRCRPRIRIRIGDIMTDEKLLDCSGLMCPVPVVRTKKELKKMEPGQFLRLIATDPGAKEDIPALIKRIKGEIVESKQEGEKIIFLITL